jgi:hypothetical protein
MVFGDADFRWLGFFSGIENCSPMKTHDSRPSPFALSGNRGVWLCSATSPTAKLLADYSIQNRSEG